MSLCRECQADIVFGRTRGGKLMPLDPARYPDDDEKANLAIYKDHTRRGELRAEGVIPFPKKRR